MSEPPTRPASEAVADRRFGTFAGVFRPTALTILGALLYLREGWVVGQAGLGGFVLILVAMYVITGATALSMASITTNIRIGKGGVFSIISQSMGLEAGGAIAVPFYLAQSLGAALYIFAFAEGWQMIFPSHPTALVVSAVYAVILGLTVVGARLAFRTQSIVLVGIIAALVSMVAAVGPAESTHVIEFWGPPGRPPLTSLFALFFPAATGILVGASMSGNLKNARRSIPRGTLAAVAVTFAIYLCGGIWFAAVVPPESLRVSYDSLITHSRWPQAVLAGLLASTLSATLSSLVAAPRVLSALAGYGILPGSSRLAQLSSNGEPRTATLVTALIVVLGLMSGSLDALAPLLTVFFLIAYASLNFVVLVEQALGLPSFRPTFRIHKAVPLVGTVASLLAILATSPIFGLLTLSFVIVLYVWLVSRRLPAPFETARSGLVVNVANWAARKIGELPASTERSWKPDLLAPVRSTTELQGSFRILRAITTHKGSVHVVGLATNGQEIDAEALAALTQDLKADGITSKSACLDVRGFGEGTTLSLAVLRGTFLAPNVVLLSLQDTEQEDVQVIRDAAAETRTGLVLVGPHPEAGLGRERSINVWVRDQSPDWELSLKMASVDLSLLLALQIQTAWRARLRLICVVDDEAKQPSAHMFLHELCEQARVPGETTIDVIAGGFTDYVGNCPQADINIFGLPAQVDADALRKTALSARSTCLFVQASGKESALA